MADYSEFEEFDSLGGMTTQSESGGDASAISTGRGDIGGKSYGSYQLASNTGTLNDFISQSSKRDEFKGISVGSPEFDRRWKKLASDPEFNNEQKNYITKTHYEPVAEHLRSSYGIDPSQSKVAQELIFSTANQMGAGLAKKVFDEALSGVNEFDEATLVDRVTDVKSDVDRWFKSSPVDTKQSVLNRFQKERDELKSYITGQPQTTDDYSEFENYEQPQPGAAPEEDRSFGSKLASSAASSVYGIESAVAAAPGLAADAVFTAANAINTGINAATNAIFGKKYLKQDYKAPKELYDIGGTVAEKVGAEDTFLGKALSSKELKKQQEQLSESGKMAEEGKGLTGSLVEKVKRGDIKDAAEYIALSTVEQAPQNALAAIVSIVSKNPSLGLSLLAGTSASSAMQESIAAEERGEGTDRGAAVLNAINTGLMEYAGEKAGTAEILKPLRQQFAKMARKEGMAVAKRKATSFAKTLLKNLTGEVKSEMLTQAGQDLGAMFTGTKDITLAEFANNLADAGVMAVAASGPLTTLSSAVESSKQAAPVTETTPTAEPATQEAPPVQEDTEAFFGTGSPESFVETLNNTESPSGKDFMMQSLSDEERGAVEAVLSGETPTVIPTEEAAVTEAPVAPTEEAPIVIPRAEWSQMTQAQMDKVVEDNPAVVFEGLEELVGGYREALAKYDTGRKSAAEVIEEGTPVETETFAPTEEVPVEVVRNKRPAFKEGQKTVEQLAEEENLPKPDKNGKIKISEKQRKEMSSGDIIRIKKELGDAVEFVGLDEKVGEFVKGANKPSEKQSRAGGVVTPTSETMEEVETVKEEITPGIEVVRNIREPVEPKATAPKREPKVVRKKYGKPSTVEKATTKEDAADMVGKKSKYTTNDMITLSKSRKGRENIKTIASEAGVKLASNKPWQKFALEYAKKKGTIEDIDVAEELYNATFSESRVTGVKKKKQERAEKTGDKRTTLQKAKDSVVNEIVNSGAVPYDADKHGVIIKSIVKNEQGKFVPRGINKTWSSGIDVIDVNGKPYISFNDRGIEIAERQKAGRGGVELSRSSFQDNDKFDELRYSKAAAKKAKYEEIVPTKEQTSYAKSLTDKDYDVQIQNGLTIDGEISSEPSMFVTSTDPDFGTTISVPLNATKEQILKKFEEKRKAFNRGEVKQLRKEMRKLFPKLKDEDLPEVQFGGLNPEIVLANHEYGVIGRRKSDGKLVVAINDAAPKSEIASTVAHELLGHFGASKVISEIDPKIGNHMYDLFQKDAGSDTMNDLIEAYGEDEEVLFDEWVAKNVEDASKKYFKNGKFQEDVYKNDSSVLKKVMDTIKRMVGNLLDNWFSKPATKQEIDDATIALMQRFGDIETTPAKTETRYNRKRTAAQKAADRKRKLKTYATDRMNLNFATSAKNARIRFYDFAMKHFYGPGSESVRRELFKAMDAVKNIEDPMFAKVLKRVDEYSDWQSSRDAYSSYKKFKNRLKSILSLNDPKVRQIKGLIGEVDELNSKLDLYKNLKRLANRGEVDRPYLKGTTEYGNPGERYQKLIDAGYIDMDVFEAGAYQLNDAGKEKLKGLKDELTTLSGDMFGTTDIVDKTNAMRELYSEITKSIKETKVNKKTTVNEATEAITKGVATKTSKAAADARKGAWNKVANWIKNADATTLNLEYIVNNIDNFDPDGPMTKYVFDPLFKGHTATLDYGFKVTDLLKDRLASVPKEELIKMSPSFQGGLLGTIEKATSRKPETKKVKLDSGKEVDLTPSQRISIHMLAKSPEGIKHIASKKGGFSHDVTGEVYRLTENDIRKLSKLSKNEQIVADTYAEIADMVQKDGNKVSNKDVGYDIFTEENYHPFLVRKEYIEEDVTKKKITTLDDMRNILKHGTPGVLKKRRNSEAPIVLEGVFESFARTLPVVEKYIGSALPSKQVDSILNDSSLKAAMAEKGLDAELSTIKKLVDEYNGANIYAQHVGEKTIDAIQSLFTVATLGYKPHVAFIQPAALMSYLATSPVFTPSTATRAYLNFAKTALSQKEQNRIAGIVREYSPYLRERFEGNIDFAVGETRKASKAREMVIGGKTGWRKWISSEGAMAFMMEVDKLTNMGIWRDLETVHKADKANMSEDAFNRMIAREAEKVIRQTQATHDQLSRPRLFKSKIARPITMFTSEPVKKMMLTRRLIHEFSRNPQKNYPEFMFRMSHLFLFQPLGIELVRQSFKRMKGEEDDIPEELDEMLKWFGKRILIDNIGIYPVVGSMVASKLSGFTPDIGGAPNKLISTLFTTATDVAKFVNDEKDISELGESFKKLISLVAPVKGLEDLTKMLRHQYDNIVEFADDNLR